MSTPSIVQEVDQAQAPDGPRERFLDLFEVKRRGTITNYFLSAVRSGGASTPQQVVRHVLDNLYRRLDNAHHWVYPEEEARLLPFVDVLEQYPEEALGFAGWAIAWCALPEEERERVKRQRYDTHRAQWMGERQPSEKQLHYLAALGWRGEPPVTSMLEASNLINELKARREGAQRG